MPRLGLAVLLCIGGCGGCQEGPPAELRVGGATPYVRCLDAEPPPEGTVRVRDLTLRFAGRDLHIENAPRRLRIAAFSGPAPSRAPMAAAIAALSRADLDLVIVLGSIGDDRGQAEATLAALGALPLPVLVLAGGRDDAAVLDEAFEATDDHEHVVDARPLRRVLVSDRTLLLLSGAPDGRYARTDTSCGYGRADVERLAGEAGEGRPVLVSWAAPAGSSSGHGGIDAGDPALGRLARRLRIRGGIFAWPESHATATVDGLLRVVVAPISGPPPERADGSPATPGATLLRLDGHGLALANGAP
jgi:hypothetical protein